MSEERYKHGQVLWALWHGLYNADQNKPIPKQFATRVRRMADLGVPIPVEERPSQAGVDVLYEPYHVFELGLALALSNVGLNQGAIARFIEGQRKDSRLRNAYYKILDELFQDHFMIFALVEFIETHGFVNEKGESLGVRGVEYPLTTTEVHQYITKNLGGDARIIVGLKSIAEQTTRLLRSAPETKRGRRKQ